MTFSVSFTLSITFQRKEHDALVVVNFSSKFFLKKEERKKGDILLCSSFFSFFHHECFIVMFFHSSNFDISLLVKDHVVFRIHPSLESVHWWW